MTAMMRMAAGAGMTDMPPMELVMGSMMSGDPDRARPVGTVLHWLMMGTIVFGFGYAGLFTAADSASSRSVQLAAPGLLGRGGAG
jgi:hypothetical protein